MKLTVTEIQRFCMHDGPGVRTTVFLKGCPLRCGWCHNPETQKVQKELLFYSNKCIGCGACVDVCTNSAHELNDSEHFINRSNCVSCGNCAEICPTTALEMCGSDYEINELVDLLEKDKAFYGNDGGITVSGGEPFMQGDSVIALLRECKNRGLHTVVETCGHVDHDILCEAVQFVDLFLWDIKDTDPERHKNFTGVSNERILTNLKTADQLGATIKLRCILVNGVNTNEQHYQQVAELANSLNNCEGVEFFPYHAYGGSKATFLGHADNGKTEWIPTKEQLAQANHIVNNK